MRPAPLIFLALLSCTPEDGKSTDETDVDTDTSVVDTGPDPVDLVTPLGADEARAGVITDSRSLFAGVSAEGRAGDILLINDRVRFVLQSNRPASYYVTGWGGIIDADVVRPEGELGRDLVEKWSPMFGLGRILMPVKIEVVNDGTQGGAAHVRVEAIEAPLALIEGAVEVPDLIVELGLTVVMDYILEPGSSLLEVRSAVTSPVDTPLAVADVLFGAPEASTRWTEGVGRNGDIPRAFGWTGYVAPDGDGVAATFSAEGTMAASGGLDLIAGLVDAAIGGAPVEDVVADVPLEQVRYYGVARQLSTLTDELLARRGTATTTLEDVVTDGTSPLAGAEVVVLVDDAPYTLAVTGADGAWKADVPSGSNARALAVGEGLGRFLGLPDAPPYAPYADATVRAEVLGAYAQIAQREHPTRGRGVATDEAPMVLPPPARITVDVHDDLPFAVRVRALDARPPVDDRLILNGPGSGLAAPGWSRGDDLDLAVAPGRYEVVVHRGMRFETHKETVDVAGGATALVSPDLAKAYQHSGWLLADPHSHASPSGDGEITMEDRLVVAAGSGIQIHFGTDHDHLADYGPLLSAMGLGELLATVVSDEVSPPLRGHMNIYPIRSDALASNGGAYNWWDTIPTSTQGIVDTLRDKHGDDFILQLNHPLDSGVASSAQWRPGSVSRGDYWTEGFQAVEVMNSADTEFLPFWNDMLAHGILSAGVGVSDSHGHLSGHVGMSATWIHAGVDHPPEFTDDILVEALTARQTQVTRGPFLKLSVVPGGEVAEGSSIDVEALSPSWIKVDRLLLMRNGVEVARVEGTTGQFTFETTEDAFFSVIAEGDTPMAPVDNDTPWALAGPYLVDVAGDGWDAPSGALEVR